MEKNDQTTVIAMQKSVHEKLLNVQAYIQQKASSGEVADAIKDTKSVFLKILLALGGVGKALQDATSNQVMLRFSIEELELLKRYYAEKEGKIEATTQWSPDYPLENFRIYMNDEVINKLMASIKKRITPTDDLILIKGISRVQKARLTELRIYDVPSLIQNGKTPVARENLAGKLHVDTKLVTSWVKQADLWRVPDMTTDSAYMLSQIGVRCVADLGKLCFDKVYPLMQALSLAQPDFILCSDEALKKYISDAAEMSDNTDSKLQEKIEELLGKEEAQKIVIQRKGVVRATRLAFNEGEPTHLFSDKQDDLYLETAVDNGEIVADGINQLLEIEQLMPLPRRLRGTVYRRSISEQDSAKTPFPGVKVEVIGVVDATANENKELQPLVCHTDANGVFIISMPKAYNLKDVVTFRISDDSHSIDFNKNADDIINSSDKRPERNVEKRFTDFCQLQNYQQELVQQQNELTRLEQSVGIAYPTDDPAHAPVPGVANNVNRSVDPNVEMKRDIITKRIQELKDAYNTTAERLLKEGGYIKDINKSDKQLSALERKLKNGLSIKGEIDALFRDFLFELRDREVVVEGISNDPKNDNEGFVVIDEVFRNEPIHVKKALPSVKLMGSDDNPIHLSSDTAPSRIFNYAMLQRIVEPRLTVKVNTRNSNVNRREVTAALDVDDFKNTMTGDPGSFPHMSSLGMGYLLNMHQAWVPDGFALGDLLYSLILAPGEEQRIVVRENNETYSLYDTAAGSELVSEAVDISQQDDAVAAMDYAVRQQMNAGSSYEYSTKTSTHSGGFSLAACIPIVGALLGGSAGYSGASTKTTGKGSASASQSNAHNEASTAAQSMQHSIKSATDKISQAKRVSISTATASTSESLSTKVIANHNHSHAMTVQYWEVMRRYRLESCIDKVDLTLFVPLKLVRFLPEGQPLNYAINTTAKEFITKQTFDRRYANILRYANVLRTALPWKHRNALSLVEKFSALPMWKSRNATSSNTQLTVTLRVSGLYCFDNFQAVLHLSGTSRTLMSSQNNVSETSVSMNKMHYVDEVKASIRNGRKSSAYKDISFNFNIPNDWNAVPAYVELRHWCDFQTFIMGTELDESEERSYYLNLGYTNSDAHAISNMMTKLRHKAQDDDSSSKDTRKISHYRSQVPDNYKYYPDPYTFSLNAKQLKALGAPSIEKVTVDYAGEGNLDYSSSGNSFANAVTLTLIADTSYLTLTQFRQMEEMLQHVVNETMAYSQSVWASLSKDELVMLLDRYTLNMDFSKLNAEFDFGKEGIPRQEEKCDIPLLNCIDVYKVLGFYGNCILFPFTYPQQLAKKLGKTAGELQDALYRYHTNTFRAPTTTVSLPTKGMIGEAVLGETNVSEVIDITRFWNWQDSPIDSMGLSADALKGSNYLDDKTTQQISALNLVGAAQPQAIDVPNLINTLASKQAPQFDNLTGQQQLSEMMTQAAKSNAEVTGKAVTSMNDMLTKTMDSVMKQNVEMAELKNKLDIESLKTKAELSKLESQITLGWGMLAEGMDPSTLFNAGAAKPNAETKPGVAGTKPGAEGDGGNGKGGNGKGGGGNGGSNGATQVSANANAVASAGSCKCAECANFKEVEPVKPKPDPDPDPDPKKNNECIC